MTPLYIDYPSWLSPFIFPGVKFLGFLRWYSLMYVFAFGTAYVIFRKVVKEGALDTKKYKCSEDDVISFFTMGILFLLLGARLMSVFVYDTTGLYREKPWLAFWPFDSNGNFTGLAGMSFHGGVIGGLLGMLLWCIIHKQPVLKWMDVMGIAIPLGYTWGRLGNFLNNGELFGRVTTMPWGMVFPGARRFSASLDWVQEIMAQIGMEANGGLVNLPRHPSQLYEAFFEGIVLFLIVWFLRKKKPFDGFLTGIYLGGYGLFRFFIEYFREPDVDLGYRIVAVEGSPTYLNVSMANLSTGQILCLGMIFVASAIMVAGWRLSKKSKGKKNGK